MMIKTCLISNKIIQSIGKYIISHYLCELFHCHRTSGFFSKKEFIHLHELFSSYGSKQLDRRISCWNMLEKEFQVSNKSVVFVHTSSLILEFFHWMGVDISNFLIVQERCSQGMTHCGCILDGVKQISLSLNYGGK